MPSVDTQTDSDQEQLVAELDRVAEQLEPAAPQEILRWAAQRYPAGLTMACSFGVQSVVMIDMLAQMKLLDSVEIFYLDTGVLFAQTHQTRLRLQEKYGFMAVRVAPELSWEDQQRKFGGHLYERGPQGINTCCGIRKVEPLKRYLMNKAAWITGMRRSHARTRAAVPVVMWDELNGLAKINPMAAVDDATIWAYIKANDVPYNPLYDQGYPSIGCNTPVCTRPVKDGEEVRAGRWNGAKAECGIHLDGRVIKSLDSSKL